MVVPAGGAWLAVHVLQLLLLLLAAQPLLVSMAVTSPWSGNVRDNVTAHVSLEQQQTDMPQQDLKPYYGPEGMADGEKKGEDSMLADGSSPDMFQPEDIQVGCRELRAKRYISDGFCTSTRPIKEVVCAGNCLPIMDLPWYAEFVKVWARSKIREWQCEEDVVRRKSVHLLCRNGQHRTYRIKVVKSCKCKKMENQHNETKPNKHKKKRKNDKKKRRKKKRRGQKRNRKQQQETKEEEGEQLTSEVKKDDSQVDQRQEAGREGRGGRSRKRDRKRKGERKAETNSEVQADEAREADDPDAEERDSSPALLRPSR